jgi:hypothetical protein
LDHAEEIMQLRKLKALLLLFVLLMVPLSRSEAQTPNSASIDDLKAQIDALKAEYEKRIKQLEDQVQQLQIQMLQAPGPEEATEAAAQPAQQTIPGALNPAISVVGNFLSRADDQKIFNEDGNRIDNKLNLREAEIDMRVPVDPYADAVLITALESETPGQFSADVEEGYVTIKKLPFLESPLAGLKLKVGRFRPAFGKFNILHTHDLPQSFRSLPTQEFLGEDGFIQNGVSGTFFLPTPWDAESNLDATVEVLTGGDIALSPDLHSTVSYLGHLRWFRTFADTNNLELGWSSYFHPAGNGVDSADVHGVDFLYRWKPIRRGEWKSYLLGGEMMFARKSYPGAAESPEVVRAIDLQHLEPGAGKPFGYSIFSQWQFNRRIYAGLRWDQTDALFNPDFSRRSVTPYLSYYFSEFLRFRVDYEHRWSDFLTEDGRNSLYFELNWIFGSHPPEPFWVNK